jgi:hypothetical protein
VVSGGPVAAGGRVGVGVLACLLQALAHQHQALLCRLHDRPRPGWGVQAPLDRERLIGLGLRPVQGERGDGLILAHHVDDRRGDTALADLTGGRHEPGDHHGEHRRTRQHRPLRAAPSALGVVVRRRRQWLAAVRRPEDVAGSHGHLAQPIAVGG